ncbi:helix-turn-helix transcriptional regulator [Chitiniphilus purpureus]|uniref:Helix-turn-helix transcriptional regulator n=1 Tax=Chitiniphilus purpureus TaxID=2981137 RepID=A0ABY6DPB1_9NEIS|nr:helix-turn-helix domain-containing protein [Chitiniphilus sp. CD1]UXY16068.1 helix-turn-helix transcriptional regulator [Chitiniphilus sp. CD1]
MNGKKISRPTPSVYNQLEDVIGCKWSVSVLLAVADGTIRPGALERAIPGISTKVLSERLRKLGQYGLISKTTYAELPPRTEYALTEYGRQLVDILGQIRQLDGRIGAQQPQSQSHDAG